MRKEFRKHGPLIALHFNEVALHLRMASAHNAVNLFTLIENLKPHSQILFLCPPQHQVLYILIVNIAVAGPIYIRSVNM